MKTLMTNILRKANVIIGGGPVGSSLAAKLAQSRQTVTLIKKFDDLGSHNDQSRLARLAFDGPKTEFALSQQAISHLLKINQSSKGKVITAKPGLLFIASPQTRLAQTLQTGESYDPRLQSVTQAELCSQFPGYQFNFPSETRFWFHPEGYVVNPVELTKENLRLAEDDGCEIIDAKAEVSDTGNGFSVNTGTGQKLLTNNLFLLAGASNKQIIKAGGIFVPEFDNTYLTGISTIRYQSSITRGLMPITVASLQLNSFTPVLDFSTMPESSQVVKTRLSGVAGSETIDQVHEKDNLPKAVAEQNSLLLFNQIFPNLGIPIDFKRCVTYINSNPSVSGLSFIDVHSGGSTLLTTLGCYGVHVKYAAIVADAMHQYHFNKVTVNGFHVDQARMMTSNYIKPALPNFVDFLDQSGLSKTIGGTPIKKIATNLFIKQEGCNLTGSIKDRVALYVLLKKLETKEIKDNDTLILTTSGSYGVSVLAIKRLILKHLKINLNLVIVTPYAYKDKNGILELRKNGLKEVREKAFFESNAISEDTLLFSEGVFSDAIALSKNLKKQRDYIYLDQHYDISHAKAHESTAKELAEQLPNVTDVVSVTGTGATAMGLCFFLPKHIRIHSRPGVSGEIGGLSDSRNYKNYFTTDRISGYDTSFIRKEPALKQKELLRSRCDLEVSDSTGAALAIAEEVRLEHPEAVIAVISPSNRF